MPHELPETGILLTLNMISQLQVCVCKANSVFANGMRQDSIWRCAAHHNSKGKGLVYTHGGNIVATGFWCKAKTTPSWNNEKGRTYSKTSVFGYPKMQRHFRIDIRNAVPSRTSHTNPSLPNQGGGAIFNMEAGA